jgi:hypothetical protein
MDLFSFLSFHFICVTVTVVTCHSVALSRHSHLFSTMSSWHDVLVHDIFNPMCYHKTFSSGTQNGFTCIGCSAQINNDLIHCIKLIQESKKKRWTKLEGLKIC